MILYPYIFLTKGILLAISTQMLITINLQQIIKHSQEASVAGMYLEKTEYTFP